METVTISVTVSQLCRSPIKVGLAIAMSVVFKHQLCFKMHGIFKFVF
jgi:hypothetical protein